MAVDMFLKIDGVTGESADAKHKGEIEILSFSWGATQQGAQNFGGGLSSGKIDIHDLSFMHKIDKASPQLLYHACTGTHIKEAILSVRSSSENAAGGEDYLTIKLSDLLVSSFQAGANGQAGEIPMEQVSMNFSKIEMEYKPQDAAGRLGPPVSSSCGDVPNRPTRVIRPPAEK